MLPANVTPTTSFAEGRKEATEHSCYHVERREVVAINKVLSAAIQAARDSTPGVRQWGPSAAAGSRLEGAAGGGGSSSSCLNLHMILSSLSDS